MASVNVCEGADAVFRALRQDGGVVVKGMLSAQQVEAINADIDPVIAKLEAGSKSDSEWTKEFHGSNTKRLTNLPTISRTFREQILDMDILHDVCDKVFLEESGTYWMNTAQVIQIGPGNKAQELHRDQMQYPVFTSLGPEGPEACVNWFVALTRFTDENGATRIIPGSHQWLDYSNHGSPDDTIPVEMEAGDVFLFSGKVVHGGGANRTQAFQRRGIALSIQCSYLTPEEAYPFIVKEEFVRGMAPRVQRMIAFRSQFPKHSPGLWMHNYTELADHIGLD